MTFQELTHARYSLRKFSDRPVEEEKLELVLKAAQSAPTAHNAQPQRILVLRSAEAREKAHNCTPFHFGEPVLLVISCNEEASWHRDVDGKAHGEIDAAIATTQMMLQAADIGLGTTYIGVFDPAALKREFPAELEALTPIALLPLGYPAEGAHPSKLHSDRKPLQELVKYL